MKHFIIVKLKDKARAKEIIAPVRELFEETLSIEGIHGVKVSECCIDRPNRYHLMIVIDMDKEALEAYDVSEPHKKWKEVYGDLISEKTIFDSED